MTDHYSEVPKAYEPGSIQSEQEADFVTVEPSYAAEGEVFLALRHDPKMDNQQFIYLNAKEATDIALDILAVLHKQGYDLNGEKTNE